MSEKAKTPTKRHKHDWKLGHYTPSSYDVIRVADHISTKTTEAKAEFVCECGAFKTVKRAKS